VSLTVKFSFLVPFNNGLVEIAPYNHRLLIIKINIIIITNIKDWTL